MTSQYESRRIRLKRIEAMLQEKPMTKSEVAAVTGYSRASVWGSFDNLIGLNRIYVAGWKQSARGHIEQFAFGNLPDAPKPVRHLLGDDEEVEIKRRATIVRVRRDPLVAALFGAAQ